MLHIAFSKVNTVHLWIESIFDALHLFLCLQSSPMASCLPLYIRNTFCWSRARLDFLAYHNITRRLASTPGFTVHNPPKPTLALGFISRAPHIQTTKTHLPVSSLWTIPTLEPTPFHSAVQLIHRQRHTAKHSRSGKLALEELGVTRKWTRRRRFKCKPTTLLYWSSWHQSFLIRRTERGFVLLGDAYVHGVMNGEAATTGRFSSTDIILV